MTVIQDAQDLWTNKNHNAYWDLWCLKLKNGLGSAWDDKIKVDI